MTEPILRATDLVKEYPVPGTRQTLKAVAGVSLELSRGETLGVVGESGCGKSTLARLLVGLENPTSGKVELDGADLSGLSGREARATRRRIQMVFQDPYSSLNPRQKIGRTIEEVIQVHRLRPRPEWPRRVGELLNMVGLSPEHAKRYPHELSGGQRQRVGIARALAVEPEVLVLDEPVSALDVSVQSGIMNLLDSLGDDLGVAYVFISHDLGMVRHISDRIAVMYLGKLVEEGPWKPVSDEPLHPYTMALQDAVPVADPEVEATRAVEGIIGEVPDPASPPSGCTFHPRCPLAEELCTEAPPALAQLRGTQRAACHVTARRMGQLEKTLA